MQCREKHSENQKLLRNNKNIKVVAMVTTFQNAIKTITRNVSKIADTISLKGMFLATDKNVSENY